MKIMYRKYRQKEYEEITWQELQHRLSYEYEKALNLSCFIVVVEKVEKGILYFSEADAYDW